MQSGDRSTRDLFENDALGGPDSVSFFLKPMKCLGFSGDAYPKTPRTMGKSFVNRTIDVQAVAIIIDFVRIIGFPKIRRGHQGLLLNCICFPVLVSQSRRRS